MATEPVPAGTHSNPPQFWRGKSALTEFGFGFGFGFSPILKNGGGAGNGETCTRPDYIKLHNIRLVYLIIWIMSCMAAALLYLK